MKSLIEQLKIDEGFSKMPYRCTANKLTIGYGYNLEANMLNIDQKIIKSWIDFGIYEHEAEAILLRCVNDISMQLERKLVWWSKLNKARQGALINMGFMGVKKVMGFKQMLRCLERGDWVTASAQALDSKWASDVGERAQRVAKIIRDGK